MAISITQLRVEAVMDAGAYTRGAQQKAAADAQMVESGNKVAASIEQTERRLTSSSAGWEKFVRTLQGVTPEQLKFEAGQKRIEGALARGSINLEEHARLMELLRQRYLATADAANENARAMSQAASVAAAYGQSIGGLVTIQNRLSTALAGTGDDVKRAYAASVAPIDASAAAVARHYQASLNAGKATRDELADRLSVAEAYKASLAPVAHLTQATKDHDGATNGLNVSQKQLRASALNLSFQLNDVATSLASGISPMRTLAQQGGQIVQVFQQGGGVNGVLGAFASSVRAFITPTTLAVAGFAALAGGFALIASRAAESEATLRSFNAALGGGANAGTAAGLQQAARQLRDMGVAAKDANAALSDVARNPLLNPNAGAQFTRIGADVGTVLGQTPDQGVKTFASAVAGGVDATVKLGISVRALNVDQATNILTMARHGQQAEAMAKAVDLIGKALDGTRINSLSEFDKAVERLSASWKGFLDRLAESGPFKAAEQALQHLADTASKNIGGVLAGAAGGAVAGGVAGSFVTPILGTGVGAVLGGAAGAVGGAYAGQAVGRANGAEAAIPSFGGLAPEFSSSLQKMISDASEQGITIGITSGLRSTERQAQLWSDALAKYGSEAEARKWVAPPGNSMHERGLAADLSRNPRALDFAHQNAEKYGLTFPLGNEPWHIEMQGARGSAGLRTQDVETLSKVNDQIARQREETARLTPEWQKFGSAQQAGVAADAARTRVLEQGGTAEQAAAAAGAARAEVIARTTAELGKERQIQELTTQGALAEAKAFGVDAVAGYKAAADAQARLIVTQEPLKNFQQEYQRLLQASAAEALSAAGKAIPAIQLQVQANERLAAAVKQGAAADHEQALQNQATAATHDALNKALATGNDALISQARNLTEQTLAQIKANDAARVAVELRRANNQDQNQIQVLQLEISLQGQTTEEISRQVALLREKQRLDALGSSVTQQERADRLAVVDALGRQNIALSEATRAQQRLDEGIRSVADTVDNQLVTAMQNAFDGKRVTDWGAQLKGILSQILSQIANFAVIRPLIGSALGALGFNSAAQNFGSFGSLFGGGGGSSLGTAASGASLASSSGLFGDIGGSINSFGARNLGTFAGIPNAAGSGLLGTTSLTSLLGGAGLGFGGGALLNSLLGGNTAFGTAGAGAGGIAGSLLGAIVPGIGPLLGGLIGGAGGGLLGGLLGNNRPANNESAAGINLSTGQIGGVSSKGVGANDQAVRAIVEPLSQFVQNLTALTGGSLSGSLGIEAGSRDGTKLRYSNISGYGSGSIKLTDAAQAQQAELILAKTLTGVSDTMKHVLDQLSDPGQLQDAVATAKAYDQVKSAFENAFQSIEKDTQTGPFAQAMAQIKTAFSELSDKAKQFGLALEPVDAALAAATNRLQKDFNKSLDEAVNSATGRDYLNQLETIGKSREQQYQEAQAIGLSRESVADRLNAITGANARQVLQPLSVDQLNDVIGAFKDARPEFADMARTLLDAAAAAKDVAVSFQSLQTLLDNLRGGALSGLTAVGQASAANDNFQRELALVRGGNAGEIDNLAAAGSNVVSLYQSAYGNAPQTARIRNAVISGVDQILSGRSFADGGVTAPGWNLVGERGPEWLQLPGGSTVLPSGSSNSEVAGLLRELLAALQGGNRIAQSVGGETVKRLERVHERLGTVPISEPPRRKIA